MCSIVLYKYLLEHVRKIKKTRGAVKKVSKGSFYLKSSSRL